MAALVEGQQYGLSSQGNHSTNKTLVFVKLTDSALRAIEEYVRARGNSSLKPTIQFQANQGIICLPRPSASSYTKQSYDFTLSHVEADGPQGSFECLQQGGTKSLESLGCMLYKMHIHANEDSYEKTRVKMAAVEQENKKYCTKEIKPSGPYIGRKAKVKRPLSSIPTVKPSSPPYSYPTSKPTKPIIYTNTSSSQTNQFNSSINSSRQFSSSKLTGNPDIMRRSSRDRIIHLLALRPYKKPELLARLIKDGIREKDKKGLSAILTQVAVLKENTYNLARHIWNEVRDDWPFYTPEESELLRKKQQNLIPQNENGIPSPSSTQPSSSPIQKRGPSDYETPTNKKQRISHYSRVDNSSSLSNSGYSKPDSSGLTSADKVDYDCHSHVSKKEVHVNGHVRTNWNGNFRTEYFSQKSPSDLNGMSRSNGVHNLSHNEGEKSIQFSSLGLPNGQVESTMRPADSSQSVTITRVSPDSNTHIQGTPSKLDHYGDKPLNNGFSYDSQPVSYEDTHHSVSRPRVSSTTNGSGHTSPTSSPDSRDSMDYRVVSELQDLSPTTSTIDFPEYMKKYGVIANGEQRAQYKADFNAQYAEYRSLHSIIKRVSKRFAAMENELRNSEEGSEEWHRIKEQIVREYEDNKQDPKYQDARKRFQFLHNKLAHIKRLVMEYDHAQTHSHAVKS